VSEIIRAKTPEFTEDLYTKSAPVQNVYDTAFELKNVSVLSIALGVVTAGETLQVKVTIDGVVITGTATACNVNEHVEADHIRNGTALVMSASGANVDVNTVIAYTKQLTGKDVLIEIRKTTAAGAGDIHCDVVYHQW
jgi:hypothetical protein